MSSTFEPEMRITFAHIIDGNLGDHYATPALYFNQQFSEWSEIDVCDFRKVPLKDTHPLIVGGGGLLHPGVDSWIAEMSFHRPVILWGVGLNYADDSDEPRRRAAIFLHNCKLVSVRNRGFAKEFSFNYVPDVSCMAPELDAQIEVTSDAGVYHHFQRPFSIRGVPSITNENNKSLSEVIQFIGSKKVVITNSYHGAYWAGLLNRRTVIWEAWSSRFYDLVFDGLAECREMNVKFYKQIESLLR